MADSVNEFMSLYPKSRIFAFEADRVNYGRLCRRYLYVAYAFICSMQQLDKKMVTRSCIETTTMLLIHFFHSMRAKLTGGRMPVTSAGKAWETVDAIALDTFCRERGVEQVDIMKLDIQGSELMALKGAAGLLNKQDIRSIFCEIEFRQLYEGQPLFWEISAYLMSFGYQFFNIVSPKG